MGELVAVTGDEDDHNDGQLKDTQTKVFANGKAVAILDNLAENDALHPAPETYAKTVSSKVFVTGKGVHRNNDLRYCDGKTVVTNQTKVFAG